MLYKKSVLGVFYKFIQPRINCHNYTKVCKESDMQHWCVHDYGGLDSLTKRTKRIPMLNKPSDVLVKVIASSVNPIDTAMISGYGKNVISTMLSIENIGSGSFGCQSQRLPLTVGRDFVGEVVSKGQGVTKLSIGDYVWGIVGVQRPGCHAQYVVTDDSHVVGVCGKDAFELVESCGAVDVHNYRDEETIPTLTAQPCFDVVFNCGAPEDPVWRKCLKEWSAATYVSFSSPLLRNAESFGIIQGFAKSLGSIACDNLSHVQSGRTAKWAFFIPNQSVLIQLVKMVDSKEVQPIIDRIYEFDEIPLAYKHLTDGPTRGKIVIKH